MSTCCDNVEHDKKIEEAEKHLRAQLQTLASLRKQSPRAEVQDYVLKWAGTAKPVRLSELFGKKDELILVHNMGASCPGCTAWADGFNALHPHVADRAAFVLSSPDRPEDQAKVKEARRWTLPMVSSHDSSFTSDMGFTGPDVGYGVFRPGVSAFRRVDGKILRTAKAPFGPGDLYNPVPHLLDLLEGGSEGWFPKLKYAPEARS